MINITFVDILVLLGALVVAPITHLVIAYVYAPRKAKQAILDAIVSDPDFQNMLIGSLTTNFLKPIQWQDDQGDSVTKRPIDIFSEIGSRHIEAWMKSWLGGQQSQFSQEYQKLADEAVQSMPNSPIVALLMNRIPKKYRGDVLAVANMIMGNQQS